MEKHTPHYVSLSGNFSARFQSLVSVIGGLSVPNLFLKFHWLKRVASRSISQLISYLLLMFSKTCFFFDFEPGVDSCVRHHIV